MTGKEAMKPAWRKNPSQPYYFAFPKVREAGTETPRFSGGPTVQIFFVKRGRGRFLCLDETIPVQPGQLIILGPGANHAWRAGKKGDLVYDFINLREWDAARIDALLAGAACRAFSLTGADAETFRECYDRLVADQDLDNELNPDEREGWYTPDLARALVGVILALVERSRARQGVPARSVRFSEPVRLAREFLREHWAGNPSAEAMAAAAGRSPGRLRVMFRRETGLSPREFVLAQKVLAAKYLMVSSDLALKEIARRVGFAAVHSFTTFFTQRTGQPPGQWRRRARG